MGGVLQTFGQQHFVLCSGQLASSAAAFKLAPSRKLKSVVLRLNASNATAATTVLKIPMHDLYAKARSLEEQDDSHSTWPATA